MLEVREKQHRANLFVENFLLHKYNCIYIYDIQITYICLLLQWNYSIMLIEIDFYSLKLEIFYYYDMIIEY